MIALKMDYQQKQSNAREHKLEKHTATERNIRQIWTGRNARKRTYETPNAKEHSIRQRRRERRSCNAKEGKAKSGTAEQKKQLRNAEWKK